MNWRECPLQSVACSVCGCALQRYEDESLPCANCTRGNVYFLLGGATLSKKQTLYPAFPGKVVSFWGHYIVEVSSSSKPWYFTRGQK